MMYTIYGARTIGIRTIGMRTIGMRIIGMEDNWHAENWNGGQLALIFLKLLRCFLFNYFIHIHPYIA